MKKTSLIKLLVFVLFILNINHKSVAQVAVTTDGSAPHASAMLEIKSTSKGFLGPRMNTSQRTGISSPAAGLMVYDTELNSYFVYNGSSWSSLGSGSSSSWGLTGNGGTNPATNFIGTTDDQPIIFKVSSIRYGFLGGSIFWGHEAGINNAASSNIGIGTYTLSSNTSGNSNSAIGHGALRNNINGTRNNAFGSFALFSNQTGYDNAAFGYDALVTNLSYFNSAFGNSSLANNTSGHDNTGVGYSALKGNPSGITGSFNTSVGAFSLSNNSFGHSNTAVGYFALLNNSGGQYNTAMGTNALSGNTGGFYNTAYGYNSLSNNSGVLTEGNTAIGSSALFNNIFGDYNTALGYSAGYNLPNNVNNVTVIGYGSGFPGTQSNHVNIGNDLVTWNGGRLPWSTWSDKRMKDDVQEDVPGLDFIIRLKPVTYHINISKQRAVTKVKDLDEKDWEGKYDIEKIKMTGFLAQDVEAVAAEINYEFSGVHKPKSTEGLYSLQYAAFVVPLVKAVQEQQQIIEKLMKRIEALETKLSTTQKN
jgi:hypothetical protein